MHERLAAHLQDNRDQIIESWLTEADVPAAPHAPDPDRGFIPLLYLEGAFDAVLAILRREEPWRSAATSPPVDLNDFLGSTCACKQRCFGGRVCMELHDAGLQAFLSVCDESWDPGGGGKAFDSQYTSDLINHALSGFFGRQIQTCKEKERRTDCPFSATL